MNQWFNLLTVSSWTLTHSDAYYNLGVSYAFKENAQKAIEMFNKALDIQPDHLLAGHAKKLIENNL